MIINLSLLFSIINLVSYFKINQAIIIIILLRSFYLLNENRYLKSKKINTHKLSKKEEKIFKGKITSIIYLEIDV